jgi:hypothetical protein
MASIFSSDVVVTEGLTPYSNSGTHGTMANKGNESTPCYSKSVPLFHSEGRAAEAKVEEGSPEMIGKPDSTVAACMKQFCDSEMIDEQAVNSPAVAHIVGNDSNSLADCQISRNYTFLHLPALHPFPIIARYYSIGSLPFVLISYSSTYILVVHRPLVSVHPLVYPIIVHITQCRLSQPDNCLPPLTYRGPLNLH